MAPTRRTALAGIGLLLAGCAGADGEARPPAPEIARPGQSWFNVAHPVPLASLRGRVVVVEFWTASCINCIHVAPILRAAEQRFGDQIAIIGVHTPKFPAEKPDQAVAAAVRQLGIRHPVVNDPDMAIWHAYGVEGWPTLVLVDASGRIAGRIESEPESGPFQETLAALIEQARRGGRLRPTPLALTPPARPPGRFLFPGKLKPLPGAGWVLADAGHNQVVELANDGSERRRHGDGRAALADGRPGSFNGPQGLIADERAIYVADTGNHAIRRIDRATGAVTTLAGNGTRGWKLQFPQAGSQALLGSPWDLALAGERLFFAAAGTHQIGVLDLTQGQVAPFAGTGAEGIQSGPAAGATFAQPSGLALSPAQDVLYVADSESSAIRRVTLGSDPQVTTLVGKGLFVWGDANGPLAQARLQHPLGVAVWGEGRLLVADTLNDRLRVIDLAAGTVSDFDGGRFTCDDPLCLPARQPAGVWADGPDRVFMVDSGNGRVDLYTVSTRVLRTWAH